MGQKPITPLRVPMSAELRAAVKEAAKQDEMPEAVWMRLVAIAVLRKRGFLRPSGTPPNPTGT